MTNKGMIIVCIVAIIALVGWLAALYEREQLEETAGENDFLKAENARLETLLKASEENTEPSTVEAFAALAAKCRRCRDQSTNVWQGCCEKCETALSVYCAGSLITPADIADRVGSYGDHGRIAAAIEKQTERYLEAQKWQQKTLSCF